MKELEVWQKAHQLTLNVYRATENFPRFRSIRTEKPAEEGCWIVGAILAEGCGRWSDAELARYVQVSMGSASELQNHSSVGERPGIDRGSRVYGPAEAISECSSNANCLSPEAARSSAKYSKRQLLAKSVERKANSAAPRGFAADGRPMLAS